MQKQIIFETVNRLKCHACVDEIYADIHVKYPNISKATVYRVLKNLSEEGKIGKVTNVDGVERFDHLTHKHYHIKCKECGKLFDVEMDYIGDLENKIKNKNDFVVCAHDIIFEGICPACQKK